jgi:O-antigen/teichoic acid export membrane protein
MDPRTETTTTTGATESGEPSIRLDLASAYAASAARVGSWAVVSALVFRASPAAFAVLALIRATIGILNYTSLGLGPAMVHALAHARRRGPAPAPVAPPELGADAGGRLSSPLQPPMMSYAGSASRANDRWDRDLTTLFVNGIVVAALTLWAGVVILFAYVHGLDRVHDLPPAWESSAETLALHFGFGTLMRLASDAPGAVLQVERRIALDNVLLAAADGVWVGATAIHLALNWPPLLAAGAGFGESSVFLLAGRLLAAVRYASVPILGFWRYIDGPTVRSLLRFGAVVALAQVADFLYAPTDYFLINRLIDPLAVATYSPAVQVDAGLLLLVSGLAAVLLPRSAVAYAAGDAARVRRYYVRGTLAGAALLLAAALTFWALSPVIFRLWLGSDLPATRRLLPLVLLHTVVGGSAAVGRSVLLATGKVRAFTASVLIAGAANVALSYALARFTSLGLYGIVLGTVIVVTARCMIWMPWYVLRTLASARPSG